MHVLLGLLGSIITILILLNRLAEAGIDLGGLNPFLWRRRRKWLQKYEGDPIYKLDDPMDVTALLMVAVAKSDGDMTQGEKKQILQLFREEFHLSPRDASDLMVASVYLLKDGFELRANIRRVLAPSLEKFTPAQAGSALDLIDRIARFDRAGSEPKQELVNDIGACLASAAHNTAEW
jgi:hypothetical protein